MQSEKNPFDLKSWGGPLASSWDMRGTALLLRGNPPLDLRGALIMSRFPCMDKDPHSVKDFKNRTLVGVGSATIVHTDVPFGDQFWALSSIIQCTAIQLSFPGKIYLYTVATYSQHYKTLKIFTSRVVFPILRPISVALTRHQFWAVVTQ